MAWRITTTRFCANCRAFTPSSKTQLGDEGVSADGGLPSFLRMGSWIGGDRDGNPFVDRGVLRAALRAAEQPRRCGIYLDELHRLGGELSLDSRLVGVSPALHELAERSPDRSPTRDDEPYRRAITGIYARLAATARALDHRRRARSTPVGAAPPYADSGELLADLDDHRRLAGRQRLGERWPRAGCRHLRRAVDVFGFHLAALDLRQNSDVHERVIGELLGLVAAGPRLRRARRARAHPPAAGRTGDGAAARLAVPRLFGRDRERAGDPARGRRGASPLRRRPRCRIT